MFSRIDFQTTDECNLNCAFCYSKTDVRRPYSREIADSAMEFILKQPPLISNRSGRRIVSWGWMGGEPLLYWPQMKEFMEQWRAACPEVEFNFGMTSNMVLATPEVQQWCRINGVSIQCSFDGCRAVQEIQRGHFDEVEVNAKEFIRLNPRGGVRATITPDCAHLYPESVKYFVGLGFKAISGVPASCDGWTEAAIERYGAAIRQITNWWIEEMMKGRFIYLWHFRRAFAALWNPYRQKRRPCGAGTAMIGVDTAGNLWPCHRFCHAGMNETFKLGNLEIGITSNLPERIAAWDARGPYCAEACNECPAVNACGGPCMYVAASETGDLFQMSRRDWPFCQFNRLYWAEAMRAHAILNRRDCKTYLKQFGGHRCRR